MTWEFVEAGLYRSDNGWWIEYCTFSEFDIPTGWYVTPPVTGHGLAHEPCKTLREAKAIMENTS